MVASKGTVAAWHPRVTPRVACNRRVTVSDRVETNLYVYVHVPRPNTGSTRPTIRQVETDVELLNRLRDGDEEAFVALVTRYQEPMLRLACSMVQSRAVAEEAVQDTWMGVVRGIDRFEGRSSLKTWLFRILANRARSAGTVEHRHVQEGKGPAADPSRFDAGGGWAEPLDRWVEETDERIDAAAWSPLLKMALDGLPARQRQVVLLRDVEGLSGTEVCDVLSISAGNQRLLLHRGRSQLRDVVDAAMRR
jgi:RNA polymerase sigma-70 factor, ECF subfamily